MGMAILPILVSVLDAIVICPYIIHLRQNRHRSELAGGSALVHCVLLALCTSLGLLFGAQFLSFILPGGSGPQALRCVSFIAGGVLCREFVRRLALANRQPAASLAIDLCVAVLQVATLVLLAFKGILTAETAFASWGGTSIAGALIFIARTHRSMRFSRIDAVDDLKTNFRMGKWLLPGQVALIAQYGAPAWLAGLLFRPQDAALFTASASIVMVGNTLLTGIGNVMLPRAAAAFRDSDAHALLKVLVKSTMMNIACMAMAAVGIVCIGPMLVRLVYAGRYSQPHSTVLVVLSIALVAKALGMGANIGYWVIGRPQINLVTNVCGFAALLLLTFMLKQELGIVSVVWAVLLADLVPGLIRWWTLLHLLNGKEVKAMARFTPQVEIQ
jgi:O-antigen/teichoic acid export membrane protein